MHRGHWKFSHWEWVFVGRYRDIWGRVYDEFVHRPVYEFVSEIDQIESETRRLWALKGKLEAESAVLDTYIEVARKHAVLNEALAIPGNGQLKQLPYTPAFSMQRTR